MERKNHLFQKLLIVTTFSILFLSINISAQEVKPEDCNKSDANFKVCFGNALSELKFYKDDSKSWVKLLKDSQKKGLITSKQLDESKQEYETAKKDFDDITNNLRNNPNFVQIKIRLKTAIPLYDKFVKSAETKLNKEASPSSIVSLLLNTVIDVLTGNPRQAIVNLAKQLAKDYVTKKAGQWEKWDSIKAS